MITPNVGETKVRFGTRRYEHCNTDKKSAIFKFKQENRIQISDEDFEIIDRGYTNTVKRKLAEALFIKELNPVLNEQVKSAKLCLFNWQSYMTSFSGIVSEWSSVVCIVWPPYFQKTLSPCF